MTGIQFIDYDIDIRAVRDSSGKISSGWVLSDVLAQNQALILQLKKGELKDDVSVGVGISDMLLDEDVQAWRREIREQLEMDGQQVKSITVSQGKLIIDSTY